MVNPHQKLQVQQDDVIIDTVDNTFHCLEFRTCFDRTLRRNVHADVYESGTTGDKLVPIWIEVGRERVQLICVVCVLLIASMTRVVNG